MKSTTSSDLQRIYRSRFGERTDYRERVWNILVRDYFQHWVRLEDSVLDLGAGYGEFINAVSCGKKYAMDLNPDTPYKVHTDVTVFAQDCAEPWPVPSNNLDVVFTSNFFEHLPDQQALNRTLDEVRRCVKPGGRIIAMGPNLRHTGEAYWDIIDHHLPLTEQSLSELLLQKGFHVEICFDKFLPFTMSDGPQYPSFFIELYLRLPFAWRIFGKQFLVIGRKESV